MMKNNEMSLDYFRRNDLAFSMCRIQYSRHSIDIPFTYNEYFGNTTIDLLQQLKILENTKQPPVAYNARILSIFTNYFACLEQFISTVFEVLYFYKNSSVMPTEKESIKLFRQDYKYTIQEILKILKVDKISYDKLGLDNKIREMEDARNYILHGNIGHIKTKKTLLPQYPLTINIEDIFEELDIIINFIEYFRYIFPNIDLMPGIYIPIGKAIFNRKLDKYFYNVLMQYLGEILRKHGLKSTKSYKLNIDSLSSTQSNIAQFIGIYTKAIPDEQFGIKMNTCNTNFYIKSLANLIDKDAPTKNKEVLELPRFMLNKEGENV